jgi:hypothetical protein
LNKNARHIFMGGRPVIRDWNRMGNSSSKAVDQVCGDEAASGNTPYVAKARQIIRFLDFMVDGGNRRCARSPLSVLPDISPTRGEIGWAQPAAFCPNGITGMQTGQDANRQDGKPEDRPLC